MMTSYNRLDALPMDCLLIILSYGDKFLKDYNTKHLIHTNEFQEKFKERFLTSEDYDNAYNQDFKMLFLHNQLLKKYNMSSFYIEENKYDENVFFVDIKKRKTITRKVDKKVIMDKMIIERQEYIYEGEDEIINEIKEQYEEEPSLIPTPYLYDNIIREVRKKGMSIEDIDELKEKEMGNILSVVCDINEAINDYIAREGIREIRDLDVVIEIDEDEVNDKLGYYERYYLLRR